MNSRRESRFGTHENKRKNDPNTKARTKHSLCFAPYDQTISQIHPLASISTQGALYSIAASGE